MFHVSKDDPYQVQPKRVSLSHMFSDPTDMKRFAMQKIVKSQEFEMPPMQRQMTHQQVPKKSKIQF